MSEQWPEVTLDTPIEELKEIHKRIWDICIDKYDGMAKPETPYQGNCIACEIAKLRFYNGNGQLMCLNCPMFRLDDICTIDNSLFDNWYFFLKKDPKKALEYAKKIRDYKWKEETIMSEQWPEVTLDTPIEELKEIHTRIWNECIDRYRGRKKPITPYKNDCVGCEIAKLRCDKHYTQLKIRFPLCYYCPIFRETDKCMTLKSLYTQWVIRSDIEEFIEPRLDYAKRIRDYKWREE